MKRSKVTCPDCGQEVSKSNFSKHQRRHKNHPETFEVKQSSNLTHEGLDCQFCGKTCKNRNSLRNHERLCKSNPDKQTSNLSEYNSTYGSVHTSWNKGLSKDIDDRVAKNGDSIRQHYKTFSSPSKGRKLTEEHKNKISNTILEKSSKGEWHTSLARRMHYSYKGQDLHGTWELEYAKWLDSQGITWVRNTSRFTYIYQGKKHYYTPDFYLVDRNCYIEIKGYTRDIDIEKWKQFPKTQSLQVLFYKDLIALGLPIKR